VPFNLLQPSPELMRGWKQIACDISENPERMFRFPRSSWSRFREINIVGSALGMLEI